MFAYIWPLGLVVLSNVLYHVCTKLVSSDMNPLASITVTYLVGAVVAFIAYHALYRDASIIKEYSKLNWAPFLLGIAIVGLEAGYIYVYRAGWSVNSAQIVASCCLAVVLIFVGYFFFHEAITWNKILGIVVCLVGILLINYK